MEECKIVAFGDDDLLSSEMLAFCLCRFGFCCCVCWKMCLVFVSQITFILCVFARRTKCLGGGFPPPFFSGSTIVVHLSSFSS